MLRFPKPCRAPHGFTLIELMVTVAVITLLLMVALPAYRQQLLRSHRVAARAALLDLAAREERYRAIQTAYSDAAQDLGYATLPLGIGAGDAQAYYTLSVSLAPGGQHYSATASPLAGQADDAGCYAYTLDDSGSRGNQDAAGNPLPAGPCW